jgi:phosphate:Na+ symporter
VSLAVSHLVDPAAALALVLDANLGTAINPLLESGGSTAKRRLPLGNLINRAVGVALVLPFLQPLADRFARYDPNPGRMTADFHTAFNLVIALVFFFLLDGLWRRYWSDCCPSPGNVPIRPRRSI